MLACQCQNDDDGGAWKSLYDPSYYRHFSQKVEHGALHLSFSKQTHRHSAAVYSDFLRVSHPITTQMPPGREQASQPALNLIKRRRRSSLSLSVFGEGTERSRAAVNVEDQEWVWTNRIVSLSVCGAEQEATNSSVCLPKSCSSGRMEKERGEEEDEDEAGVFFSLSLNAQSVQSKLRGRIFSRNVA